MRDSRRAIPAFVVFCLVLASCSSGTSADEPATSTSVEIDSTSSTSQIATTSTTEIGLGTSTTTTSTSEASVEGAYAHPECREIETLATWYAESAIEQLELKEAARRAADEGDMNVFRDGVVAAAESFDRMAEDVSNFYENESELLGISGPLALVVLKARQDVYGIAEAMLSEDDDAILGALAEIDESPHAIEVTESLSEGIGLCPLAEANVQALAGDFYALLP